MLNADDRRVLLEAPRPRLLELAPHAARARRKLPLVAAARAQDAERPIYILAEITRNGVIPNITTGGRGLTGDHARGVNAAAGGARI